MMTPEIPNQEQSKTGISTKPKTDNAGSICLLAKSHVCGGTGILVRLVGLLWEHPGLHRIFIMVRPVQFCIGAA